MLNTVELDIQSATLVRVGERHASPLPATQITPDQTHQTLTLAFEDSIPPGKARLDIQFSGTLNDKLHGFYRSQYTTAEGAQRYLAATQFEATDARRAFPCWDEPACKARFQVTLVIPTHLTAISNTHVAEESVAGPGLKAVRFDETPVMSTYLLAFVVGDLTFIEQPGSNGTRVAVWTTRGKEEQGQFALDTSVRLLSFFNDYFGIPYPLAKLDHIAIPDFAAGAMENVGAVTHSERMVHRDPPTENQRRSRAEVILHEMAHMWFGDLVTMTWWDDLWLNESFATFASVLCQAEATEYDQAWTTFANVEKSWAYRQDQLPSTHPVAADIPDLHAVEVNFDGITYAKGASVLKQLVAYVGLEHFLAGLRDYFAAHAFDNATFDDLLGALEKASGRDLSDWGRQWLKTTGLNTVRADFDVDDEGRFTRFAINQGGAAPGAGETRVHRLAVGIYDDDPTTGKLVRVHREELDISGPVTEVPALHGVSRGKLVLVNDDDLTYCSLRLDDDSLRTALSRIADIDEPLPRTLVWSAAWEMTRDAELKARDFVALVISGIQAETEVGV
ncbi:MAG: M1 family metallopeptidase, partial [Mycolicibacterium aromaticivorans]|nr:M1 family metallopeptidase [Mycolicibacterium aromaticivorans]